MKASEALVLGSTLLKPVPGTQSTNDGRGGCALGMIAVAQGKKITVFSGNTFGDFLVLEWMSRPTTLPCSCKDKILMGSSCYPFSRESIESSIYRTLTHLFNYHVCGIQDWTIERLADWLKTVEPQEEQSSQQQENVVREEVAVTT